MPSESVTADHYYAEDGCHAPLESVTAGHYYAVDGSQAPSESVTADQYYAEDGSHVPLESVTADNYYAEDGSYVPSESGTADQYYTEDGCHAPLESGTADQYYAEDGCHAPSESGTADHYYAEDVSHVPSESVTANHVDEQTFVEILTLVEKFNAFPEFSRVQEFAALVTAAADIRKQHYKSSAELSFVEHLPVNIDSVVHRAHSEVEVEVDTQKSRFRNHDDMGGQRQDVTLREKDWSLERDRHAYAVQSMSANRGERYAHSLPSIGLCCGMIGVSERCADEYAGGFDVGDDTLFEDVSTDPCVLNSDVRYPANLIGNRNEVTGSASDCGVALAVSPDSEKEKAAGMPLVNDNALVKGSLAYSESAVYCYQSNGKDVTSHLSSAIITDIPVLPSSLFDLVGEEPPSISLCEAEDFDIIDLRRCSRRMSDSTDVGNSRDMMRPPDFADDNSFLTGILDATAPSDRAILNFSDLMDTNFQSHPQPAALHDATLPALLPLSKDSSARLSELREAVTALVPGQSSRPPSVKNKDVLDVSRSMMRTQEEEDADTDDNSVNSDEDYDSLRAFLRRIKLSKYFRVLRKNEVTVEVLSATSDAEFASLGLPLGAVKKLRMAVQSQSE